MRILMISPYFPWPLYGGGSIRIYHVLKELSRRGHRVVLLAGQEGTPLPPGNVLNSLCEDIYIYHLPLRGRFSFVLRSLFSPLPYPALRFQSDLLWESLHRLLHSQRFDLIWVNFEIMAYTLSPDAVRGTPVVLDEHESQKIVWRGYLQQGSWWQRLFALVNLIKLKKLEQRVLPMLNAVLCVSEEEATLMRGRVFRGVEIWTVPNGVHTEFFRPPVSQNREPTIMLFGAMNVMRNVDAAVWFAKRMFPKIKQAIPDAQFWVVGRNPNKEVQRLRTINGVVMTGTVEDVRPYYEKARVCIAPYRFGGGTRLKMLEAMAMGVPIVATDAGCQGIEVVDGQHLLIANNESEFSNHVIDLLRNPQRAQELADAGRALVVEKYDWKEIIGALEPKLQELVQRGQLGSNYRKNLPQNCNRAF
ncbi:MAG: glycosyltransferase [Nitrospirota bacterium]